MLEVSSLHAICEKQSFKSLEPFAEKFSKICKNTFFQRTWNENLSIMLHNNPNPSISDLETCLWKPTLESCSYFLEEVKTLKVELSVVQSLFENASEHYIHKELTELCNLVNEYTGHQDWFTEEVTCCAFKKIKEYIVILRHQEVASLFLQLKYILQLTGDFQDIIVIASRVCMMNAHVSVTICVYITYIYVLFNRAMSGTY